MKTNRVAAIWATTAAMAFALPAMAQDDQDAGAAEAGEALEAVQEVADGEARASADTAEPAAGHPTAQEVDAVAEPPADHTPAGSQITIPAPPAGKGQIVFFRPRGMGMAMGCTINQGTKDNKTKITSLGNGRYSVVVAEPGKQDYWVKNEKKDSLTLLVEEDETQFVSCRIKMGIMSGRPDLSPSNPAAFAEKSNKLKLVDDDDMGEGARRAAELSPEG